MPTPDPWDQLTQITQETTDGSLRWTQASDGALHADRNHDALTLRRDDHHVTLMIVGSGAVPQETVLGESVNPEKKEALQALWAQASAVAS